MNNEHTQQAQATPDDPSGDGWRDVEVGEVLRETDMFRDNYNIWTFTENTGVTVREGWERKYRRRIEPQQQQPSDSEQRSESTLWGKLHAAMKQDPEFAWTVHCNYAMQIMDEDVAHGAANRAAARIMLYFHHIDITQNHHWATMFERATPQQPSDSEPETMEQLREQVQTLTQKLKDANDTYQICLQSHYKAGQRSAIDRLQWWLRPVLEVVAENPEDLSLLAVAVLGYLPGIASRLIEE